MSKINRFRIVNLNYNGNTIRIDDETFDLGGESTLFSLRNGGGKTVLVQMLISLFVRKKYRDTTERPFKSYFTTNRPTFLMVEWMLDQGQGYFLTGMMVRKSQSTEETNEEELDLITFTGFYRSACEYDIEHLPIIEENKGIRTLKSFRSCREEMERLKKEKSVDFDYYDMSVLNQRRAYFSKLREYQIYNREWETIIKRVNRKESGLSELFADAKDEKGLVEKWFLDAIENKLNAEKDRVKRFQEMAHKLIRQYRENQSKIRRKELIALYFQDADLLLKVLSDYQAAEEALFKKKGEIAVFIKEVDRIISEDTTKQNEIREALEECDRQLNQIQWERISYEIYQLQEERERYLQKRLVSEERITRSVHAKKEAEKALGRLRCAKLYEEAEDFRKQVLALKAELEAFLQKDQDTKEERLRLGHLLYRYFHQLKEKTQKEWQGLEKDLSDCRKKREENEKRAEKENEQIKEYREICGGMTSAIKNFDRTEADFNRRFHIDFSRNLLGEYEDGLLALCRKKFEEELTGKKLELTRLAKEEQTLLTQIKRLAEEKETISLDLFHLHQEETREKEKLDTMQEEKEKRLVMMRLLEAPETELDAKELLLERFERKIEETESIKERYLEERNTAKKEYQNLSQGKVMELPENIVAFFEENGIDSIYGMEWLKKNGRSVKEKKRLVEKNPFLPYSIILSRSELEKLSGKEVYTRFPIPVIIREELEETLLSEKNVLFELGGIRFLCLFNSHLLDKEELKRLLAEKQVWIEELSRRITAKKEELKEYRMRFDSIRNQSFTLALIEKSEKELEKKQKQRKELEEKQLDLKERQRKTEKQQKENQEKLRKTELEQSHLKEREEAFEEFVKVYQTYCDYCEEKERYEGKEREAEACIRQLQEEKQRLENRIEEIHSLREGIKRKLEEYQKELLRFEPYHETEMKQTEEAKQTEEKSQEDYEALKAKYLAITEGISKSVERLNRDFSQETIRYEKKSQELLREAKKYGLKKEDYADWIFSEEEERRLEQECDDFSREENAAKEENIALQQQISTLAERLKNLMEKLKERTGYAEAIERKRITELNFAARAKLVLYEKEKKKEEESRLKSRLNSFQNAQSVMAEYTEFFVFSNQADQLPKKVLTDMTGEELNRCHGELRRDLKQLERDRESQMQQTDRMIQKLLKKAEYQEDFFYKSLENLVELVGDAKLVTEQIHTTLSSYQSILKKLEVDLENIEREQKNVEETFLDYVRDIHTDLQKIDKNSTIPVRGRTIKMLKIEVPSWEDNRELYQIKIRDFVNAFIRRGIKAVEQNENVEEVLGKEITTKRLYDEVVGIGTIGIRLYKIEADREVPISWAEVSANSGGEGFLSAFVILVSLLSYMRRSETDLFASFEEGKVMVMDNPFAQTNAEHLLKPLMDMAKKTNTQLICLSGLGGESIYNRFDNIYVLKLIRSGLRGGIQYMKGEHWKGEGGQKLQLSLMRVEQMEVTERKEEE